MLLYRLTIRLLLMRRAYEHKVQSVCTSKISQIMFGNFQRIYCIIIVSCEKAEICSVCELCFEQIANIRHVVEWKEWTVTITCEREYCWTQKQNDYQPIDCLNDSNRQFQWTTNKDVQMCVQMSILVTNIFQHAFVRVQDNNWIRERLIFYWRRVANDWSIRIYWRTYWSNHRQSIANSKYI